MPIATVDVDTIVSDQALDEFMGGQVKTGPMGLAPETWQNAAKPARQHALNRVLEALRRRTPPIVYADLAQPTELADAVMYGAAEHLWSLAMTGPGDLGDTRRKYYGDKFDAALDGLTPTLSGGLRGTARSFGIERR